MYSIAENAAMRSLTLWMLAWTLSVSLAQRFPDRWITILPLLDTTHPVPEGTASPIHSSAGWAEFGGYPIDDSIHAWIQRLGAVIELVRIGSGWSIAFATDIEFIADPNNDIRFNPRAVFWQEGLLLTNRIGNGYWQLGYYHRCKHDVDNLSIGTERSLIYGSVTGKYAIPLALPRTTYSGAAVIRGDIYTIRQDDRTGASTDDGMPDVRRLLATLGGSLHLRSPAVGSWLGLYTTLWATMNFYSHRAAASIFSGVRSVTAHGGITAGIAITGTAHFRIGIAYEYLADTGINPLPQPAHLVSVTMSLFDPSAMW
jgi:hypothetical protein